MKVGSGRNLGLSREYSMKPFVLMLYSWCNCPLKGKSNIRTIWIQNELIHVIQDLPQTRVLHSPVMANTSACSGYATQACISLVKMAAPVWLSQACY